MSETPVKAPILYRIMAKAVDLIAVAVAVTLVPTAGVLAGALYMLLSDGIFEGSSLGKKLMKLKVVAADGGQGRGYRDSIIRNAPFAVMLLLYMIPFVGWIAAAILLVIESLLMLGNPEGMRFGDDLAATRVIEG